MAKRDFFSFQYQDVIEVQEKYRNINFRLSSDYEIYDWVDNDVFTKFSKWVK